MTKKNVTQLPLIQVDNEPIPGTHLYRRWQNGSEVQPEYRGDAQNELFIEPEVEAAGYNAFVYQGETFVRKGGQWYRWQFPTVRD